MSFPSTLTDTSGSSFAATYTYKQTTLSGGFQYYGIYDSNDTYGGSQHDIKVDTSSPYAWSDAGTGNPVPPFDTSNGTVTIKDSNDTVMYAFSDPNSGNSGNNPQLLSNSGSLRKVGSDLVWTISSVSQDGSYYITESSDGGVTFSLKTTIVIPNVAGTRTGNVLNWDESYIYKFYDPLENPIGSYRLRPKVFCNFW